MNRLNQLSSAQHYTPRIRPSLAATVSTRRLDKRSLMENMPQRRTAGDYELAKQLRQLQLADCQILREHRYGPIAGFRLARVEIHYVDAKGGEFLLTVQADGTTKTQAVGARKIAY